MKTKKDKIIIIILIAVHIPLERNSQSATAERLSAPNGKFVVS